MVMALGAAGQCASAAGFAKAIWGDVYRNGVNQFPIYHQLGVSIYEAELQWNVVAPSRPAHPTDPRDPAYRWPAEIDQALAQAARSHMRVLLEIRWTPGWANGGRSRAWAPTMPSDFAAFAAAASRRYPGVHLWMIWAEPTRKGQFQPITPAAPGTRLTRAQQVAPHSYAALLDASYGALKRVSSKNLVIGGNTYTTGVIDPQQWVENLRLANGRPPRMDMYGHNPFSAAPPDFSAPPSPDGAVEFSDLPRLGGWIDRNLRKGMPIFISEWTIPTRADQEFNFYVDPSAAAQWITKALRQSRHWNRIYALGWINLYDRPPASYGGLIQANGKKKPLFYAFERG
jgi:hypothetical protein